MSCSDITEIGKKKLSTYKTVKPIYQLVAQTFKKKKKKKGITATILADVFVEL